MMESFIEELNKLYLGKKVAMDLFEFNDERFEFEWDYDCSSDFGGDGLVNLDSRPYLEGKEDEYDYLDDEICEDDEEYEDYYDEREEWSLETGLRFNVNSEGVIGEIELFANVYGDPGLGESDPEEEWLMKDFDLAKEFFDAITGTGTSLDKTIDVPEEE